MKRYKIDLSASEFFALIKVGHIGEDTQFESYDVADPVKVTKVPPKAARKTRRTRAQIEADTKAGLAPMVGKRPADQPDITQRPFPWKDEAMNTAVDPA